jgi:hypothetical protein
MAQAHGRALRQALAPKIVRRSLMVALVVGLIMNGINQEDRLLAGQPFDWLKVALTFVVPFCVATCGAFFALKTTSDSD